MHLLSSSLQTGIRVATSIAGTDLVCTQAAVDALLLVATGGDGRPRERLAAALVAVVEHQVLVVELDVVVELQVFAVVDVEEVVVVVELVPMQLVLVHMLLASMVVQLNLV